MRKNSGTRIETVAGQSRSILDSSGGSSLNECKIFDAKGKLKKIITKAQVTEIHQNKYLEGDSHRTMSKVLITKICDYINCKKVFKTRDRCKKFCQNKCTKAALALRHKKKTKKKTKMSKGAYTKGKGTNIRKGRCDYKFCRKFYETVRNNQRFCSLRCKSSSNNKIKNDRKKLLLIKNKKERDQKKKERIAAELKGLRNRSTFGGRFV